MRGTPADSPELQMPRQRDTLSVENLCHAFRTGITEIVRRQEDIRAVSNAVPTPSLPAPEDFLRV